MPYVTYADLASTDPGKGISLNKLTDGRDGQQAFDEIIEINVDRWYTSDNWADAIESAVALASSVGGIVVHTPGRDYGCTRQPVIVDKNVRIDWSGARTLRKDHEDGVTLAWDMFTPTWSYSDAVDILSITTESVIVDQGTSPTPVTKVALTAGSVVALGLTKGTIAKIVSDTLIPWSIVADNERLGQHSMIYQVDTGTDQVWFYCELPLAQHMATAPRLAKMEHQHQVCILENMWLEDDPNNHSDTRGSLCVITGANKPQILNPRSNFARSEFIQTRSCYRAYGINLSTDDLNTDWTSGTSGSLNRFGYGWRDTGGSTDTLLVEASGTRFRHVTDTGARGLPDPEASVVDYGGSVGFKVSGGIAALGQNAAYGTHPDAYGAEVNNVTVRPGFVGKEAVLYAIQMRGENCSTSNCTTYGRAAIRYSFYGAGSLGTIKGHRHVHNGEPTTLEIFRFDKHAAATGAPKVLASGLEVEMSEIAGQIIKCDGVDLDGEGIRVNGKLVGAAQANRLVETNTKARVRRVKMDIVGSTTAQPILGYGTDDAADITIKDLEIVCDPGLTVLIGHGAGTDCRIIGRGINIEGGTTSSTGFSSMGGAAVFFADITYDDGTRQGPGFVTTTYGSGGSKSVALIGRGQPHVVFAPTVNSAAGSIDSVTAPAYLGQRLTIGNDPASTNSIDLTASTNVAVSTTQTLAPGVALNLIAGPGLKWMGV